MFKGNSDGNSIHYNVFEVPIIAQWVRINPTRWHDRISMRVELYGCDYSKFLYEIKYRQTYLSFEYYLQSLRTCTSTARDWCATI